MNPTRLKKVERLLQKELSLIFQQNKFLSNNNVLISVTAVRVSSDLAVARVYLSIFPTDYSEKVLEQISKQTGKIKYELGNRIKNQLRKTPDLKFFIDDSLDYADKITQLLNE